MLSGSASVEFDNSRSLVDRDSVGELVMHESRA